MANYGYDVFSQKDDIRAGYRALSEPPLEPEALFPAVVSWHEAPAQYNCDNFYEVKQPGASCNFSGIEYYSDNYQHTVDVQLTEVQLQQDFVVEPIDTQNYVQTDQLEDSQYVLITTANCIDCDKVVDLSKDDHSVSECVLLKPFECKTCGERFNFKCNMDVHEVERHISNTDFAAGTSCSFCTLSQKKPKTFSRFHGFKSHLKSHYKPDIFNCNACSEEFDHEALYLRHRRLNHRPKNDCETSSYSSEVGYCPKCRRLIRTQELASHKITHKVHQSIDRKRKIIQDKAATTKQKTPKNKHQCDVCSKSFRRPAELRRHTAVHEGSKRWACSLCQKKFVHESGLLSHKKLAHSANAKQFPCKICKAVFTKKSNVERHVKQNHPLDTTKYLFDCEFCSVQLQTRRSLQRHIRMYHMEGFIDRGIHQCGLCYRNFPRNYNLQRHLLSCTFKLTSEELQNRCNRCGKGFKFRASLIRHMEIHTRRDVADPTLTDPKCPVCMKHISSKSNLAKHMLTHQANYECPDCFQRFTTVHRLDRHRCVPLNEEVQQQRELAAPTQQVIHAKLDESFSGVVHPIMANLLSKPPAYVGPPINPQKSYFCKQCPSSFFSFKAFKEHKNLHFGVKPHICWICNKSFRTQNLLEIHKQFHTRENICCEYCPQVLSGRTQFANHVRTFHQSTVGESSVWAHRFSPKQNQIRADGAMSTQSYTEDVGRQLAESLFQARALSADPDQPNRSYVVLENDHNWRPQDSTVEAVHDRAVRCDVCFHQYNTISSLIEHWSMSFEESTHAFEKIRCPLCSVTLRGASEASGHMMYVHPYLTSQSVNVGAGGLPINTNPSIIIPQKNGIQKQKCHACTYCEASFTRHSDLVRHTRRHTGEKPFVCQICNRGFSVKSTLNAHSKTHERGNPELVCPMCPKTYFTKSALVLHLRVHSGVKPLRCRFCGQAFRTSNKREAHERTIHGKTKETLANPVPIDAAGIQPEQHNNDLLEMLMNEEISAQQVDYPEQKTIRLATSVNKGQMPDVRRNALFPVKRLASTVQQDSNLVATMRQISRVKTTTIQQGQGSAFAVQSAPDVGKMQDIIAYIYITARRLSDIEYSVVISRNPPKAIRIGIDETFTINLDDMISWAENDIKLHLSLPQYKKLSLSIKGVLSSLGSDSSVTLRARPIDPIHPLCVELVEEESTEVFCKTCDICEMEFTSKVMSDAHFASDDHEAAQYMHPPSQFVPADTMPVTNLQPRKEVSLNDYNCKLCGRKYLDMEPLIAHIRRDHERDHQQQPIPNCAARPAGAARTAPPAPVPQFSNSSMS